uniref:Uncharacterized protein n=1 Tax=Cyanoptyche gloeocystis TaxID=77922 RepID=A0A7S2JJA4_9EUKA|mmetsp:Transcript_1010/g.1896  ORF Transcript_1010/g.1896 Transcript_1010/m.1896 type:complete len:368 (+) Transcript_1010:45-1148(+)
MEFAFVLNFASSRISVSHPSTFLDGERCPFRRLSSSLTPPPRNTFVCRRCFRSWSKITFVVDAALNKSAFDPRKDLHPITEESAVLEDLAPILLDQVQPVVEQASAAPLALAVAAVAGALAAIGKWGFGSKNREGASSESGQSLSSWLTDTTLEGFLAELALDSAALEDIIPVLSSAGATTPIGSALWSLVIILSATAGDSGAAVKRPLDPSASPSRAAKPSSSPQGVVQSVLPAWPGVVTALESNAALVEDLSPAIASTSPAAGLALMLALVAAASSHRGLADLKQQSQPAQPLSTLDKMAAMLDPVAMEAIVEDILPVASSGGVSFGIVSTAWAFVAAVLASAAAASQKSSSEPKSALTDLPASR